MTNLAFKNKLQGLYREDAHISLYVADLGAYVSGYLRGVWVSLPLEEDELEELYGMAEELAIHDYECDFMKISEYENIRELNELAERMEEFNETELEVFKAYMDGVSEDVEEAIEAVENQDYMFYNDCDDMSDVAEQYCEETDLLSSIPESLRYYFDFEAYGRDMEINGNFIFTDNGNCVEFY